MSRNKIIVAGILVAFAALTAGVIFGLLGGNTIYPGVQVAQEALGRLTIEQAEQRLASLIPTDAAQEQVVLRYAGETTNATIAELGGGIDVHACALAAYRFGREGNIIKRIWTVASARRDGIQIPIVYSFDKEATADFLQSVAKKIDREPVNASLTVENGSVKVLSEKPGIKMGIDKSLEQVFSAINSGARTADLVVEVAAPKLTAVDFKGIDSVISSYSTVYKPWQRDRTHNLRIACRSINGTILKPGDIFSYNKVVGPRLKELGFREAPIFVNGEVEPGTGGGVCQVSTTVYNAALLSDMKIVKRFHHSRPVAYASVGRDATVAYSSVDLKFRNTSDGPIYIQAWVGKKTVNITLFGKEKPDQEVQIVSSGHRVISIPVHEKIMEKTEEGVPVEKPTVLEKGLAGHRVSIYRIVKINGSVVKRELISNDYYRPQSRIIAVPKPKPESTPEPVPIDTANP